LCHASVPFAYHEITGIKKISIWACTAVEFHDNWAKMSVKRREPETELVEIGPKKDMAATS
jgi:hypothetical protein